MATKRVLAEKKKASKPQPRLVFDEPHIFRMKSEQALSHLKEHQEFTPCIACSKEADRRQSPFNTRPQSSYMRQRSTPPPSSSEQRPSTATKKKFTPSPPTQENLERLSRPKTAPPERLSNNCNWNNFIKKKKQIWYDEISLDLL